MLGPDPALDLPPAQELPPADVGHPAGPGVAPLPLPMQGRRRMPLLPRRSPRLAATEEPLYVSAVEKSSLLKKRKMEGSGRRPSVPNSGALPMELLEVVTTSSDAPPLPLDDLRHLGIANGVTE
jgi:hypothetical protein